MVMGKKMGKVIRLVLIVLAAWVVVGLLYQAGLDVFGLIGDFMAVVPGWVRGVLTGLVIVMVIRYLFSGNSNGEDGEDGWEESEEW